MKFKGKWLLDGLKLSTRLVREQFFPLIGVFIVSCSLNITVEDALQLAGPNDETQRWVMQISLGIWGLAEWVLLLLILSWGLPKVHKFKAADLMQSDTFATPYMGSFFAEFFRMIGNFLLWALLLIIPGFYRYFQLIFMPYFPLLSRSYREGHVDAKALSLKLAKGGMFSIFFVMVLTNALSALCEFAPQIWEDLHILLLRIFFALLSFLISVWSYSLIFLMFEDRLQKET